MFFFWLKKSSAGSYLFVSHTGFGGVAYAMAILCITLEADANLTSVVVAPRSVVVAPHSFPLPEEKLASQTSDEEAQQMGDYRDILSLTRVLTHGPESKANVDTVIER